MAIGKLSECIVQCTMVIGLDDRMQNLSTNFVIKRIGGDM
jgi:hypothetical protein